MSNRQLLLLLISVLVFALSLAASDVAQASGPRAGRISMSVRVVRSLVAGGDTQTLIETVRSPRTIRGVILDLEVYDRSNRKVFQAVKTVNLAAREKVTLVTHYRLPHKPSGGTYRVTAGVFGRRWKMMYMWDAYAGQFAVAGSAPLKVSVTGQVDPHVVWPGGTKLITATVAVSYAKLNRALADIEVYIGKSRVCQYVRKDLTIRAGGTARLSAKCAIARDRPSGTYVVRIGVFSNDWRTLYSWNFYAATFVVQ